MSYEVLLYYGFFGKDQIFWVVEFLITISFCVYDSYKVVAIGPRNHCGSDFHGCASFSVERTGSATAIYGGP